MAKAHGAAKIGDNLGRSWRVSWYVVRVESTGHDSTTSLWTSLARGMRPGHSLREVPVAGTCVSCIF